MKLVTYRTGTATAAGVVVGEYVYPVATVGAEDALGFIAGGAAAHHSMQQAIDTGAARPVPLREVQLLAPLLHPPRIFGIGLNYVEHAAESKMAVQAVPTVFLKLASSITGPDTDIPLPENAIQPDFEVELAVVIGEPGHRIAAADAQKHVFGYTIVNDVSARGVQLATTQWTLGKSFPGFTPMGPWIVTADEIPDPEALEIKLTLNGEVMQNANTRDLIFKIPQLIEYISSIVALQAGDIISTGTPPGVGLGRTPQRWLQPDELMVAEISGIGALRNTTRAI